MDGDPPKKAWACGAPGCDFQCTLGEGTWWGAHHAQGQAMQLPGLQQCLVSGPASFVGRELVGSRIPCPVVSVQP